MKSGNYGQVEAWSSLTGSSAAFRGDPGNWSAGFNPRFQVIEETADFIAVDKPAPLQMHPAKPGSPPTLLDGLRSLLAYDVINGARLSLINRLDRETSGVVIVAKTGEAARVLGKAMMRRAFEKEYLAVVTGWPAEDRFLVDAPILRQGSVGPSRIYLKQAVHPAGAPCRTEFKVERRVASIARQTRFALVRAHPITGRMHQIRVHLAHAGFPVVGDKLYGPDESCYLEFIETGWTAPLAERLILPRHALHSARLAVTTDEFGPCQWTAPLPPELLALL